MEVLTITIDNTQKSNDKKFLKRVIDDIIDSAMCDNSEVFECLSCLDMGDTNPNTIRVTLKLKNEGKYHKTTTALLYIIHAMLENLCEADPKIDVIWQETDTLTNTQGAEYMSCVYAVALQRLLPST